MASCLNTSDKEYNRFDVEHANNQAATSSCSGLQANPAKRRKCNVPLVLSLVALALGTLGLIFGVYGAVVARKSQGINNRALQGVQLTSFPDKDAARVTGSMWQGTGYFARLQPMMFSRSDHRSLPLGDTIYLVGGLTNARPAPSLAAAAAAAAPGGQLPVPLVLNRSTAYNTYTQSYAAMADMPEPRFRHCGAVWDKKLLVIGGMAVWEAPTAQGHTVSDRVMLFDPVSNSWQLLPGRLNHPRADCCAATVGGKVYVAGGWTTDYMDTLGSVEVYDPAAGSWSFATNLTLPRGDCEAVSVADRYLVVLGGVNPGGSFTSSVEALDTASSAQAWSTRSNMTKPRGDFAAEALPGNRIIVMGGETTNGSATEFAVHDVEEYNFRDDHWITKAPLPEARFRFDTAHVGEMVYVFGGAPTCSSVLQGDGDKPACLKVALNSTWGYFDIKYPEVYYSIQRADAAE